MEHKNIILKINNTGIHESAFIDPGNILFLEEVRGLCEANACRQYGTNWACPPAVGTVEQCREKCLQYDTALVFTTKYVQKDYYDFEEWGIARKIHGDVSRKVHKILKSIYPDSMMLSGEGCSLCKECTYPDAPCRFPERMSPAIESYGIQVMDLSEKCGIKYHNGEGTITYFSAIFFNAD